ncbi:AI-2E family transporter [Devosia sp. 919]|uniref:AI-2E family transporter n=1 Tax=Devosia sp. 919 TaxID=2726065 RepID=UPI00155629DF|nr:AI-2E family transporter [Devosia sp. 919]
MSDQQTTPTPAPIQTGPAQVALYALVIGAVVGLMLIAWFLRQILLLFFAAILLAVIIWSVAELVRKILPLRLKGSVAVACLIIVALVVGLVWLMGAQVVEQVSTLHDAVPLVASELKTRFGLDVQQWVAHADYTSWLQDALGYVPSVFSTVSSSILVVAGGVFLALDPQGHREGALLLVPRSRRERLRQTLNLAARSLQHWLAGQVIAMVIIGGATAAVLAMFGVPSALALGLIAGLLEFVPYVGAIVAYVPLGLAAIAQGVNTFWWVLGVYVLIQQSEGNILMPLLQKRTVEVPPVVALFSVVGLALLFGPLGIVLGVPLTVVLLVALRELYIIDVLGEPRESARSDRIRARPTRRA